MMTLIGEVPDSWPQATLGKVCAEMRPGPTVSVQQQASTGTALLSPRAIRDGRIDDPQPRHVRHNVAERWPEHRLLEGDLVCTRTGSPGSFALVDAAHKGWLCGGNVIRMRLDPERGLLSGFLLSYLALPGVADWVGRRARGSAIRTISTQDLRQLPVLIPPLEVQESVAEVLAALDAKAALHLEISRTTTALRHAVVPTLLDRYR
ncbi:restriction endonuclease subunit S [Streptacidiphilus sp. P02-A3a]|uniref:restriction endonuclease subunit S n=1 Tax=Streptacidiphilus sp. P02-A3a TaxID=2704468 RepID=UPI0015F7BF56|nr:restriction endonuclease subunit S [Streptacidiphilus sp. P02-A3a]QMU72544.1 hypothetical protein GXP74_34155 [Streptacidiphilus sp. P02-A3a]